MGAGVHDFLLDETLGLAIDFLSWQHGIPSGVFQRQGLFAVRAFWHLFLRFVSVMCGKISFSLDAISNQVRGLSISIA
jgi:hypothetical protein